MLSLAFLDVLAPSAFPWIISLSYFSLCGFVFWKGALMGEVESSQGTSCFSPSNDLTRSPWSSLPCCCGGSCLIFSCCSRIVLLHVPKDIFWPFGVLSFSSQTPLCFRSMRSIRSHVSNICFCGCWQFVSPCEYIGLPS